jgi:adenylosuccinate synthase
MTRHYVVLGLGFGDEGKGSVVHWLTGRYAFPHGKDRAHIMVRFNGGAQAGHNVIHGGKYGDKHTFSQFGSGYHHGLETFLSRFSLVDPLAMIKEAEHLRFQAVVDPLTSVLVDRNALLVTPFHALANKARESERGADRHGSCGMGIGETMAFYRDYADDAPRVADVQDSRTLRRKLWTLHDFYKSLVPAAAMPPIDSLIAVYRDWANVVRLVDETWLPLMLKNVNVIFEGAQGVLLDQDHGFHPYTTWSKTTAENAVTLLREADQEGEYEIVGVTRSYTTRHGAGPLPTYDEAMTVSLPDPNNVTGEWQGNFRVGPLDLVLMRYALNVTGGVDWLVVTNLDRFGGETFANGYDVDGQIIRDLPFSSTPDRPLQIELTDTVLKATPVYSHTDDILSVISDETGVRIGATSNSPFAPDKRWIEQPLVAVQ